MAEAVMMAVVMVYAMALVFGMQAFAIEIGQKGYDIYLTVVVVNVNIEAHNSGQIPRA